MYALLIEVDTKGQRDAAAGLRYLKEQVVPNVSKVGGFEAGYWLKPREDEMSTSLVLFDTEQSAKDASKDLSVGSTAAPGVIVTRKEIREVAASA